MAVSKKKQAPPFYTIDSFRLREHELDHFDIIRIETSVNEIGYSRKPHSHDCYLILIITRGVGTHTVDGEMYKVEPNTVFLLIPGQVHSFEFSKDIAGFAVYFTLDFYLHYARERHLDKMPFFRAVHPQTYIKTDEEAMKFVCVLLEEMLIECMQDLKSKHEALRNFLDILLIRINRLCDDEQLIPGKVNTVIQIRKLIRLIDENFKNIKTPREYATLMALSLNHLNTLCKQSLKRTVTELIHDRIILEAKRHLTYTDWGIKKIADDIGFRETSYFLRLFKKKMGITPDQFRSQAGVE